MERAQNSRVSWLCSLFFGHSVEINRYGIPDGNRFIAILVSTTRNAAYFRSESTPSQHTFAIKKPLLSLWGFLCCGQISRPVVNVNQSINSVHRRKRIRYYFLIYGNQRTGSRTTNVTDVHINLKCRYVWGVRNYGCVHLQRQGWEWNHNFKIAADQRWTLSET